MTNDKTPVGSPFLFVFLALFVGGLFGWLAGAYPFGVFPVAVVGVLVSAMAAWSPRAGMLLVTAAMPVVDLAPWTGWLTFEEFDLIVLSMTCGAYLRMAALGGRGAVFKGRLLGYLLISIYGLSIFVSLLRGFSDAGGFVFGWYQGYYEAMNSLRLGKSFLLALLLLPVWRYCDREDSSAAVRALSIGMAVGLGLASFAAVWERSVFTGLLNFSSDYRTTALFWEMHVGGAAFDGYLALAIPFAAWLLLGRRLGELVLWGGIVGLAAYASLTTFSRGVYLAVPVGLCLMAVLMLRRVSVKELRSLQFASLVPMLVVAALFCVSAYWVFPDSGYRGILAILVVCSFAYSAASAFGMLSVRKAVVSTTAGAVVALLAAALGSVVPKGPYWIVFLGAAILSVGMLLANFKSNEIGRRLLLLGFPVAQTGAVYVAGHWGGETAGIGMAVVLAIVIFFVAAACYIKVPEIGIRENLALSGIMLVCGLGIATFAGGAYMGDRFSSVGQDIGVRIRHWQNGLSQLSDLDWWFGKGLGRYPATHFFAAPDGEHPGGYRLSETDGTKSLFLHGGKHINGWGEMFRMSQRVSPGVAPYFVDFDVIADHAVQLHFEVCEKHLLYNAACVVRENIVQALPGKWQKLSVDLTGTSPSSGPWYAPALVSFSVAVETRGGAVNLDNLVLRDGLGNRLLKNGGFEDGLAYWFSSSDRYHMPWHMKNLFMSILFDQGILGLLGFLFLIFGFFFRLTVGKAKSHPLAPVLSGGVGAFLMVGLFDSLLDVPRLACLFYLLLMIGLLINTRRFQRRSSGLAAAGSISEGT